VITGLSSDTQRVVVDIVLQNSDDGKTFREIVRTIWPNGAMGTQKVALRHFLNFMKEAGHIVDNSGKTSSLKYLPGPTLAAFVKTYGNNA
jgi:hypothetical protein